MFMRSKYLRRVPIEVQQETCSSSSKPKEWKEELAKVNMYSSDNFTRKGTKTRILIREKPMIKSWMQQIIEGLKPSLRYGDSVVTPYELTKAMVLICFPVVVLVYWKYKEKYMPERWEEQFGGLQHRRFKEEKVEEERRSLEDTTDDDDYFSIIERFQSRRQLALEKKQKNVSAVVHDGD